MTICSAGSATTPLHARPFTFLFTLPGTFDCNVALAIAPPCTHALSSPYQELRIAALDWQPRLSMPVLSLSFLPYRELTIATLDWQLCLPAPVRFNFPFYLAWNYDLQHWIGNYASPCPSFHFPRARHGRFNRATCTRTSLHLLSGTCYFLPYLLLHLAPLATPRFTHSSFPSRAAPCFRVSDSQPAISTFAVDVDASLDIKPTTPVAAVTDAGCIISTALLSRGRCIALPSMCASVHHAS
jgi:hypothetical protein